MRLEPGDLDLGCGYAGESFFSCVTYVCNTHTELVLFSLSFILFAFITLY